MDVMNSLGKKLCAGSLLALVATMAGCSLKERLPDMPKIPKIGKSEPELPGHVGAAGSGSYLFYQHCAKCHGDPPSRFFTGIMKGVPSITDPRRVRSLDQQWLYKIISEGGSALGRRATMPPFKEALSEAEIRRIVSYLNGNPV